MWYRCTDLLSVYLNNLLPFILSKILKRLYLKEKPLKPGYFDTYTHPTLDPGFKTIGVHCYSERNICSRNDLHILTVELLSKRKEHWL